MSGLAWGSHPPSGAPFEGRKELGDRCPNCDYPTDVPVEGVFPVVMETEPSAGTWVCSHCGWTMRSARHGADNKKPGVPFPSVGVNPLMRPT